MPTYVLQPGTIPFRAQQHLASLDAGAELTTAVLAEALDTIPEALLPSLTPACQHGLIARRKGVSPAGRQTWYWRVGDGTCEPHAEDHEVDQPLRIETTKLPARPASVFTMAAPTTAAEPAPVAVDKVAQRATGAAGAVTQPEPPALSVAEYVEKVGPEAGPVPATRAFDAWLSAHGALLLQGVALDEDGDAMIQPKDVAKLRQLLQGMAS